MNRYRVEKRQQLAHFLQEKIGGSIKGIRRSLEQNCCKINGRIERFGSTWLQPGTVVEYFVPQEAVTSWTILFENEDFQIVDKPVNWVCSEQNCERTFSRKLFLVHRLDKDTTGAMILAKNIAVRDELMTLFSSRSIEKEYLAVVDGVISQDEGTIDNYLAKKGSFQGQTIWGSSTRGDHAITHWKVQTRGTSETLVLCQPYTGRTHQIRVHMAEMGHPLIIDRQYASHFRSRIHANRPLLHAAKLSFMYRSQQIDVNCSPPKDFLKICTEHGLWRKS
ncbi:MAG TPA: RluA family pseudouridine synthase [Chlamydiales bacterium]|nr:RluA family pseudouridine synthase [Chlamydiales bacterium]